MEKINYRDILNFLLELFDGKMLVGPVTVSKAFGISYHTVKKRYPFDKSAIEVTKLASCLCITPEELRRIYRCPGSKK